VFYRSVIPSAISFLRLHTILAYVSLYALVIIYANSYFVWAFLGSHLAGYAEFVPILLTTVVLLIVVVASIKKWDLVTLKKSWLIAGVVIIGVALLLPDSSSPAKRIHVAEYMFLSFIVFVLLRQRVAGMWLIICSTLITTLYGAHDEMIQGLLTSRSFGCKDILVDGLSGLGGSSIVFAIAGGSTLPYRSGKRCDSYTPVTGKWIFIVATVLILQLLVVATEYSVVIVSWVFLYASSVMCAFWFSIYKFHYLWLINKEEMLVISCLMISLLLYLSSTVLLDGLVFK
jgi:hypothetical protein